MRLHHKNRVFCNIFFVQLLISASSVFVLARMPMLMKNQLANVFLSVELLFFPVIYYVFFIRKFGLRKLNMIFLFSVCCLLAYISLPAKQQEYLFEIRKLSVVLELLIVFYLFTKFNKIRTSYQILQTEFPDMAFNLSNSLTKIMGDRMVFKLLGTELVILAYATNFFGKERQPFELYKSYTVHKESGYLVVWIAMVTVIVIETVAIHFLLSKWSTAAALTMTGLSIYGLFFFISDLNAMVKRPVLIGEDRLVLRMGYRWRCIVPFENIEGVNAINYTPETTKTAFVGSSLKSSSNISITLSKPLKIDRFMKKSIYTDHIILNVDQAKEFIENVHVIGIKS